MCFNCKLQGKMLSLRVFTKLANQKVVVLLIPVISPLWSPFLVHEIISVETHLTIGAHGFALFFLRDSPFHTIVTHGFVCKFKIILTGEICQNITLWNRKRWGLAKKQGPPVATYQQVGFNYNNLVNSKWRSMGQTEKICAIHLQIILHLYEVKACAKVFVIWRKIFYTVFCQCITEQT